jgi:2-polyprenyl-3-methyl-5-hydroxy-6-metoxy-1,4-benzoquinol methylase
MHVPELGHALRELVRLLKPVGQLILSENNAGPWMRLQSDLCQTIAEALEAKLHP